MMWRPLSLSLRWGEYSKPDPEDEKVLVETVTQAFSAGFITRRAGVEKLARAFGVENVDQFVESLEAEKIERKAAAVPAAPESSPDSTPSLAPSAGDDETNNVTPTETGDGD